MHKHMALSIAECSEMSTLRNKTTVIIPTYCAHINFLLWSVFSLLLRSKPNGPMEHFCVNITGPDERCGDTTLQNEKQAFVTELRNMDWYHADDPTNRRQMPVTLIRAWSRVGWSEAFEMALGWIHTDSYTLMHDDCMILKSGWEQELLDKLYADDNTALAHWGQLIGCPVDHCIHRGMYLMRLPQMQTTFLACKKKWIMDAKARWVGFHIPSDDNVLQFDLEEVGDVEEFLNFWRSKGLLKEPLMKSELYNFVRQEVGAWVYYNLCQKGRTFNELDPGLILHFEGMTRHEPGSDECPNPKRVRAELHLDKIAELENEINQHPEYAALYNKYKKEL